MSTRRPSARKSSSSAALKRFVLVASRFNAPITRRLVRGATETFRRHGVAASRIRVCWVSGAFELPVAASRIAGSLHPDGILALGALIKGQTNQHEVIAHAVAQGLMHVSVTTGIPVGFGVIVAEDARQADARAGGKMGNRGCEAALAVLESLRLIEELPG